MTGEVFTAVMLHLMLHLMLSAATFPLVAYLLGKPSDGYAVLFWLTTPWSALLVLLVLSHLAPGYPGLVLVASTVAHLLLGALWARNRWRSLREGLQGELRAWEVGMITDLPDGIRREVDGSFTVHLEDHAATVAWWVSSWMLSIPHVVCGTLIGKVRRALYDRLQELAEQ